MLLEREALEEAEGAVGFHADALARALTERAALDGPWGLLARVWRTHARDVADCDARIAFHHQELGRARARLARLRDGRPDDEASSAPDEGPDLEAVAARLRGSGHPDAARLHEIESALATLDAAHRQDAHLHRTGSALVSAARGRTEVGAGRGIDGLVARWLHRDDSLEEARAAFAAACRDAMLPFESGTSLESQVDQADQILATLRENAIEHLRERRRVESERWTLLRAASDSLPSPPPASPLPDPTRGDDPG